MSALLWWHRHTPLSTRFAAFAAAHVVFWIAMLLYVHRASGFWRVLAIVAGLAWLPLGASVGSEAIGIGRETAGVVLAEQVIVRKGNGAGFEPQFAQPLASGVEFTVIEQRGAWLNIGLPNGATGWIESSQAELVP